MPVKSKLHCQRQEEGKTKCFLQCEHCKEYYKPLDMKIKNSQIPIQEGGNYIDHFNRLTELTLSLAEEVKKLHKRIINLEKQLK